MPLCRRSVLAAAVALAALLLSACGPGSTTLVVRSVHQETEKDGMRFSLDFPRFGGLLGAPERLRALDAGILEFVKMSVTDFAAESAANRAAREATAPAGASPEPQRHEFLLRWQPVLLGPDRVSLLLESYVWTGGANGRTVLRSFNYDLSNRRFLDQGELFGAAESVWLPALAARCRAELGARFGDAAVPEMLMDGTAAEAANFEVFTFDGREVTVHFQKYQVAPGSFGIPTVGVPVSFLAGP